MGLWKRYNIFKVLDDIERMMPRYFAARRDGKSHTDGIAVVLDWAFPENNTEMRERVIRFVNMDLMFQPQAEQLKMMIRMILILRHKGLRVGSKDDRGIKGKLFKMYVSLRKEFPELDIDELPGDEASGSWEALLP